MQPRRFAFGRTEDAYHPDTMRAALAEFLATAIFVFAAEGSVLSLGVALNINKPNAIGTLMRTATFYQKLAQTKEFLKEYVDR
ncbi:uncharacterized protein A4U43_C08F25170 [Asparagus officinalis]|nr:uncharacterized protein A4U43_C08F25170 [Asparagus officinalis]